MCTKSMHLTFLRCTASVRSCRWQVLQVSSEKNLGEKKEPSLLERISFLLRFGEHCDNSRNSQSVFLVVAVRVARNLGGLLENLTQQKMHDKFTLKKEKKGRSTWRKSQALQLTILNCSRVSMYKERMP